MNSIQHRFVFLQSSATILCMILLCMDPVHCQENDSEAITPQTCKFDIYDSIPIDLNMIKATKILTFSGKKSKQCTEEQVTLYAKNYGCQKQAVFAVKTSSREISQYNVCYKASYTYYVEGSESDNVNTASNYERFGQELNNNAAIGYQIGGNTLVGFSYEIRLSDLIGVHAGGGYRGFGFGIRLHFTNDDHSPFVDLNYKDGGFGLLESIGLEVGGTLLLLDDSGIRGSVGLQYIAHINKQFEEDYFKGEGAPPVLFAFQAGWAW